MKPLTDPTDFSHLEWPLEAFRLTLNAKAIFVAIVREDEGWGSGWRYFARSEDDKLCLVHHIEGGLNKLKGKGKPKAKSLNAAMSLGISQDGGKKMVLDLGSEYLIEMSPSDARQMAERMLLVADMLEPSPAGN